MDIQGSVEIAAPRAEVWAALNDPEVLRAAIPGCRSMTADADGGFTATVSQKIGPVSASFSGRVHLTDVVPMQSYTLTAGAGGGAAGRASGSAAVRPEDAEDGGTRVTYALTAEVDGRLAHLGPRIVHGFARKMAGLFFDRFRVAVEPAAAAEPAEKKPGWLRRLVDRGA
jgi:uncharacterized protein